MIQPPLREDFLHYLWKVRKIPPHSLVTTDGRSFRILDYGFYNTDAGPDFLQARILIDGTIWAGHIEMHVHSSDWYRHRHQFDPAYENVILHVVYEDDQPVCTPRTESAIPTLSLKGHIPLAYLHNYLRLAQSNNPIPCQGSLRSIPGELVSVWMESLAIRRLQLKEQAIQHLYSSCGEDWDETTHLLMARYFGARVNKEPFEMMARRLPLSLLLRHRTSQQETEALVFGQAGMLQGGYSDPYYIGLQGEYAFLRHKYNLSPMEGHIWKFSRLRPDNFPTLRLAQFAAVYSSGERLFRQLLEAHSIADMKSLLCKQPSIYWHNHYRFGKESNGGMGAPGDDFLTILLINAWVPLLHFYGVKNGENFRTQQALELLEKLAPEKNRIILDWQKAGIGVRSAFDSQALIELRTNYCAEHRCLSCRIGHELMKFT